MARAADDPQKKHRLFDDVSAVQVIATALAAVTSMLLSSYIGIAGSIIGVAVASVVSTLAASLYKRFLAESAEKIKELPVVTKPGVTLGSVLSGQGAGSPDPSGPAGSAGGHGLGNGHTEPLSAAPRTVAQGADGHEAEAEAARIEAEAEGATLVEDASAAPAAATVPLGTARLDADAPTQGFAAEGSSSLPDADASQADTDPASALRHQRKLVRGLVAVCIVSALLAVAASGAVVYFATTGQGLGEKPAPIHLSLPVSPTASDSDAGMQGTSDAATNTGTGPSDDSSSSGHSSSSDASSGASSDSSSSEGSGGSSSSSAGSADSSSDGSAADGGGPDASDPVD